MIVISSASFGFTPTNLGVTPAREVNPLTDVCCFVVARTTTPPASPARAVRRSFVDNYERGADEGDFESGCAGGGDDGVTAVH